MRESSLFVDNLTVIDFSYLDPLRALLGESWIVDVELIGELDDQGFIFDFSLVKKKIKSILDSSIDHSLVLAKKYKGLNYSIENNEIHFVYAYKSNEIEMRVPTSSVFLVDLEEISPTSLKGVLEKLIKTELPNNILDIKLGLRTEKIETPYYQYSHGLKKHDGNCQRIAHGHRSKIEIFIDGELSEKWMKLWASKLNDIYIGTSEDIFRMSSDSIDFEYESSQGRFFLRIPHSHCYLLESESTVEQIANHIAQEIQKVEVHSQIIVKAFEGVQKGAIVVLK